MLEHMDPEEAFALLQSPSVRVAREGSVESVKGLREEVEKVVAKEDRNGGDGLTSCINELKEYLLFPVILILKTRETCGWSLEEETATLIKVVVERSAIEDFKLFQEVFTQLFLLLTHRSDPTKVRETSEDCKQVVLEGAAGLVERCGPEVRRQLYGPPFRPKLGHAIHIILKVAAHERSTALKTQAVVTLGALSQWAAFPSLPQLDQQLLSGTFTNFLPGMLMGLSKVATARDTQNHSITAAAIDVWIHLVVLVMRDNYLAGEVSGLGESETLKTLCARLSVPQQEARKDQGKSGSSGDKKKKFVLPEPDEEKERVVGPRTVNVEVTAEWVEQTAQRLQVLVDSLSCLVSHPHWRVRLSLVHWAHSLLTHCSRSLGGSVVVAIEVLAGLRSDEMEEVSSAAQEALQSLGSSLQHQHIPQNSEQPIPQAKQGLVDILEERIFALTTQLPRICRQQDDARTLAMVRGLGGCMGLVGCGLRRLLASHPHEQRLLLSLSCLLTLDTSHPHLLQERTLGADLTGGACVMHLPSRSFQYFQELRVVGEAGHVCQLVARHGNLVAVVDHCLYLLHHTSHICKETLLLITLILEGIDLKKDGQETLSVEEREHVVRSILEAVLCPAIFDVSLYVSPISDTNTAEASVHDTSLVDTNWTVSSLVAINKQGDDSVAGVKSNVVQVWCVLDVVAACASVMGVEFKGFLSTMLCPVMEKAGETNLLVANAATITLRKVAEACGHGTVGGLIQCSVPYFWYPLSLRLKRLSQYPSAPLVLQVCLQHAQLDVLAFTEELVGEVLISLDTQHTTCALPLLRVLLVYVKAAIRHEIILSRITVGHDGESCHVNVSDSSCIKTNKLNTENNLGSERTSEVPSTVTGLENHTSNDDLGSVARFLAHHHQNYLRVKQGIEKSIDINEKECEGVNGPENITNLVKQSEDNENNIKENVGDSMEDEEEKKAVPRHIELVVEVLERCSHLLYLSERRSQHLLLEVVQGGCEALARWEDQRLPVLHKLWKPLMIRLKERDSAVVVRVLEVVATMVATSGQFLRHRCLTQFLPPLLTFLCTQGMISHGRDRASGYYLTPAYRAQFCILTKLPRMIECLAPEPSQVAEVVDVVAGYCNIAQPTQLYHAALTLLTKLAHNHSHHVWLALTHILAPGTILPPSHLLSTIKVPVSSPRELPKEVLDLYHQLL